MYPLIPNATKSDKNVIIKNHVCVCAALQDFVEGLHNIRTLVLLMYQMHHSLTTTITESIGENKKPTQNSVWL